MKILLFYFAELGGLGGVEVVVTTLAEQFQAAGHKVGIVEVTKTRQRKRLLPDGTPVWSLTAPSYPTLRRPRSWASFVRTTAQFLSIAREFSPEIVHVHFPLIQALPIVGACTLPHPWRVAVTFHGSDIRVAPLQEPAIRPWQARICDRADAITAVSQALLHDATELYPTIATKGRVIFNGVGREWFQPIEDAQVEDYVLFSGRLSHIKGVDLLLNAWSKISSRFPLTKLRIAGEGQDLGILQRLTSDLGIVDSVTFLGRRSHEELRDLYRHAKVVVLPSRREGLPLSLLEAGAAGAICVGSRTGGIPEIIEEGITGFVVDPEQPEALGDGIARTLLLTPNARNSMRKAAQAAIRRRFSEEPMISSYLELFSGLLNNSRA